MIAQISVDLGAIVRNAGALAKLVAPARLTAVVKANAYGHGLVPVARALAPHAARLCVYALCEAVALRDAGIDAPIHVLGPVPAAELDVAHAAGVQLTLWDRDLYARQVASVARRRRRTFAVHAKIDTGVVRLGVPADDAPAVLEQYVATQELELAGAFTHLAAAEEIDSTFTLEQLTRFHLATQMLDARVERHAAATAAAILWPEARLDAVQWMLDQRGVLGEPVFAEIRERRAGLSFDEVDCFDHIPALARCLFARARKRNRKQKPAGDPTGFRHHVGFDGDYAAP